MEQRRQLERKDTLAYKELINQISKETRKDIGKFNTQVVTETIEKIKV